MAVSLCRGRFSLSEAWAKAYYYTVAAAARLPPHTASAALPRGSSSSAAAAVCASAAAAAAEGAVGRRLLCSLSPPPRAPAASPLPFLPAAAHRPLAAVAAAAAAAPPPAAAAQPLHSRPPAAAAGGCLLQHRRLSHCLRGCCRGRREGCSPQRVAAGCCSCLPSPRYSITGGYRSACSSSSGYSSRSSRIACSGCEAPPLFSAAADESTGGACALLQKMMVSCCSFSSGGSSCCCSAGSTDSSSGDSSSGDSSSGDSSSGDSSSGDSSSGDSSSGDSRCSCSRTTNSSSGTSSTCSRTNNSSSDDSRFSCSRTNNSSSGNSRCASWHEEPGSCSRRVHSAAAAAENSVAHALPERWQQQQKQQQQQQGQQQQQEQQQQQHEQQQQVCGRAWEAVMLQQQPRQQQWALGGRGDLQLRAASCMWRRYFAGEPRLRNKNSSSHTSEWIKRQITDRYVIRAQEMNYRSRAAFKLAELDDAFLFFRRGHVVIDLGAFPGGWSQVAVERTGPRGRVIAVDSAALDALDGVTFIQGRVGDAGMMHALLEVLGDSRADIVLSDMSPACIGIPHDDHLNSAELCLYAAELMEHVLKLGGTFVVKIFMGSETNNYKTYLQSRFQKVSSAKPKASRAESREMFFVCRNFLGRPDIASEVQIKGGFSAKEGFL